MKRIAIFAALSVLTTSMLAAAAHAEQLFISDKLVVNVYVEANQESEKMATLESGDAIEALEKAEGFTRVKLTDGREGWIRSSYLSAQTPAVVRLKELEKERAAATSAVPAATTEEIKQLKQHNAALRDEMEALKQTAARAQIPRNVAPADSAPKQAASVVAIQSEEVDWKHVLRWSGSIAVVAGVIGFALGYRAIARRIERKYGKLKIY